MNRNGLALAADSAVTVSGGTKIFASADKIFSLSARQPVGVMVYGNADLMGVPWETIVKTYRSEVGRKSFDRLEQYADDFLDFLGRNADLFPEDDQRRYVETQVRLLFESLRDAVVDEAAARVTAAGQVTGAEVAVIARDLVHQNWEVWEQAEAIPRIPDSHDAALRARYGPIIERLKREVLEKLELDEETAGELTDIALARFSKLLPEMPPPAAGIVIGGFGAKDVFPGSLGH
jgi:hypothetical protein